MQVTETINPNKTVILKTAKAVNALKVKANKVASVTTTVANVLKVKAANATSGYLPVLDTVLAEKKGICFDYAALMTGMLRSQGIPCKMIFGYAGSVYHAWINVWTEDTGWIDGAIYFDGGSWQYLDPTFASSADRGGAFPCARLAFAPCLLR